MIIERNDKYVVKNFWHYSNDNVHSCFIFNRFCGASDYYLAYR
ncbi:hypothetical protein N624_0031 [Levilactobacillus brevis]|nr:hypothetical protein N624_0031 [Levilactobacillus brevis]